MKSTSRWLQILANVLGSAMLVWLSAPLITVGGVRPFDGSAARIGLVAGCAVVAFIVWMGLRLLRRERNARLLGELDDGHQASDVLAERFGHAMHLLRSGILPKGAHRLRWWQPRRYVYQLPWYLFLGAPGAGKTTALLHSGLRFPLAERLGSKPVAGVGGTRQCDWWFAEQAVFIDTAGRFTTHESNPEADSREWLKFLQLLRHYRPVQPINGAIVTVSVTDLLLGGVELEQQAAAVDRRLQDLRARLAMSFPIYLLVTKADLLTGFIEFVGNFSAAQREQAWGLTFEMGGVAAGGRALPEDLHAQISALSDRVAAMTPRRLQDEPLVQRRAAIYHFPAQLDALLPAVESFARRAFRSAADTPAQWVRGIHLSSGTQSDNPIDRVHDDLSRLYKFALRRPAHEGERGKAYFLLQLLHQFIIAEAPLAGTNRQLQERRRWIAIGAGCGVAAMLSLACAGWIVSWQSNMRYVDGVRDRVQKVVQEIEGSRHGDIDQLLPLYALLGGIAHNGSVDPARAPWQFDFGLFQGPRLAQSALQTYHRVIDLTLAPLLADRLAQAIGQDVDPGARYEALRIGLMLTTPSRLQRAEVKRWAIRALAASAGEGGHPPGPGEEVEWRRHLDALLERNAALDVVRLDDAMVRAARGALSAIPMEQRVSERLRQRADKQFGGELTLPQLLGSEDAAVVFARQAGGAPPLKSTAMHTRQAWQEALAPALEPTIAEVIDEAKWVLGDRSAPTLRLVDDAAAREQVALQIAQQHARQTMAQWDRLLTTLVLQVPAGRDGLVRFSARLVADGSPLRHMLRRLAEEFPVSGGPAGPSSAALAHDAILAQHFAPLRMYVHGAGAAALDRLLAPLAAAFNDPAGPGATGLRRELRAEAERAPPPFRAVWSGLADALDAQQQIEGAQQLGAGLREVGEACRRLTDNRFPFSNDAKSDMPYADFARTFGPSGLFDSFFRSRLAAQVDLRRRPWRMLSGAPLSEKAKATLHSFEAAEDIRRLFFPGTSALPELRLTMTPKSMDAELLMFSIDIDGQLLRYENGPRRPRTISWPGPAATQRVLLRTLPAGPSGVAAVVHEGPWALLRVLRSAGGPRSGESLLDGRLEVDGRALDMEVQTEGPVPAALLLRLSLFRCPEAW